MLTDEETTALIYRIKNSLHFLDETISFFEQKKATAKDEGIIYIDGVIDGHKGARELFKWLPELLEKQNAN